jgi:hypothetical protein
MRKNTSAVDTEVREWCCIGIDKKDNEKLEKTLTKIVEKETNIKIDRIEFVSDNYYHARLTDENVNNIQRDELQLLNFFTASEINNLALSSSTKQFLDQHQSLSRAL